MDKTILREEYRGLPRQALLDKAYEFGANFEMKSRSCSQSVVAAMYELLNIDKLLVKVASSSCAGQAAQSTGTCGGLVGGTMVLDYFFGRPVEKMSCQTEVKGSIKMLRSGLSIARLLYNKFSEEYEAIHCPYIQTQFFGRSYKLCDPDEMAEFDKLGGHTDPTKCAHVIGTAAQWVLGILLDKGAIKL